VRNALNDAVGGVARQEHGRHVHVHLDAVAQDVLQ